jgi:hypothetical protein
MMQMARYETVVPEPIPKPGRRDGMPLDSAAGTSQSIAMQGVRCTIPLLSRRPTLRSTHWFCG